jgi:hypothetical protein
VHDKVCSVNATDSSGSVRQVAVIARSRNDAAARAIEELNKTGEWSTGEASILQVTVHEPGATYQVSIEQLQKWARQRDRIDTIGVTALKSRVAQMLAPKRGS